MNRLSYRGSIHHNSYYKSIGLINPSQSATKLRGAKQFRLEPFYDLQYDSSTPSISPVIVENPQEETRWYWKYFLGNEHQNFAGIEPSTKLPFFISIMLEDTVCRAILWTSQGPRRLCFPASIGSNKILTAKTILQQFPGLEDYSRSLKEIADIKIQRELVILEDQEGGVNCKFGVIYALNFQTSDTQMLSNEHGDEDFEQFLKILGQRIELQDWGSYRGGLDVTTNSTGRESIYTVFAGHEIMFHVSTMLPYSNENFQQIERKRHVGNDIVNIVFEAGGDPKIINFLPTMMKSHFTHVFAVVKYDKESDCYRLWVFSEESVPVFGPTLSYPNTFHDLQLFREFLLTKLINAEKASLQANAFVEKRRKTLDTLLKDMYIEHLKESTKTFHKVTDIVIKRLLSPMKKEMKDRIDFCKYGELIKLEKMLCGDVSDAVQAPWEPAIISENILSWNVIGSDGWGAKSVVLATEDTGVVYISNGLSVPIIEATAQVMQIAIQEHFGLFLARIDKGKESSLAALTLVDLRIAIQDGNLILKKDFLDHRIPSSKGCHLFGTSDGHGLRLNIVMCISKNLTLLRWAFGPLGRIQVGTDIKNNFTLLKCLHLTEEAVAISVFERSRGCGSVRAVALTRSSLAIADFGNESIEYLDWKIPRSPITGLYGECTAGYDEIILSYQNMTLKIDYFEDGTYNLEETFWSSSLQQFVYRFPFVVGFGTDLIEVRLSINGNLLYSKYMPSVKVLSIKADIIFATEHTENFGDQNCVLNNQLQEKKLQHSSFRKKEKKDAKEREETFTNKKWKLCRISEAALKMEDKERISNNFDILQPQTFRNLRNKSERRPPTCREDEASQKWPNKVMERTKNYGNPLFNDHSMPNSPFIKILNPFSDENPVKSQVDQEKKM
ncbi:unnamed protein product [Dracunculus medinensis]|uniref:GTPase-activating Rap/Ran-GAP domain-like protein 3 n=1 Tax=Dracunculus medinensis TaxID=318479 RepID=A0A158Q3G6_DRAME|nr:unnamed protein product [Dracunculus medinensis]